MATIVQISHQLDIVGHCARIVYSSGSIINFQRVEAICEPVFSFLEEVDNAIFLKWAFDDVIRLVKVVSERTSCTIASLCYRVSRVMLSMIAGVEFIFEWADAWKVFSFSNFIQGLGAIHVFNIPIGAALILPLNSSFQLFELCLDDVLTVVEYTVEAFSSGFRIEVLGEIASGLLRFCAKTVSFLAFEQSVLVAALCTIAASALPLIAEFRGEEMPDIVYVLPTENTRGHCCLSRIQVHPKL